jgi:hypothetical protein
MVIILSFDSVFISWMSMFTCMRSISQSRDKQKKFEFRRDRNPALTD